MKCNNSKNFYHDLRQQICSLSLFLFFPQILTSITCNSRSCKSLCSNRFFILYLSTRSIHLPTMKNEKNIFFFVSLIGEHSQSEQFVATIFFIGVIILMVNFSILLETFCNVFISLSVRSNLSVRFKFRVRFTSISEEISILTVKN